MLKYFVFLSLTGLLLAGCHKTINKNDLNKTAMNTDSLKVEKTEEEWKKELTPEQYRVLRGKGTEAPFTGKFYLHKDKGVYVCAACGNELFSSDMKFDSNCGWPSFDREIEGGKIITKKDTTYGMVRTEIICARCGSHLGHIFDDGPTETGMRYCVNSVSLDFKDSTETDNR
jgi:methionine-R-sulfoxide reductase